MAAHHQQWTVDEANTGRRLDAWLRQEAADVPLGALMRWLRKGAVRVNGKKVAGSHRLGAGETVIWPPHDPDKARSEQAQTASLRVRRKLMGPAVLFEDAHLLVVDKPARKACHPGTGLVGNDLMAEVTQYLHAEDAPVGHRPGPIQRLDRGVSGLLPIGKTASSLRQYAEQAASKRLSKTYLALVDGVFPKRQRTLDAPLFVGDEPMGDRPRTYVDVARGKAAVTRLTRLATSGGTTLLAVTLETGRTHQIRAHLLHAGFRLLGDPRYGWPDRNDYYRETFGVDRPLLHAAQLKFDALDDKTPQAVWTPPPIDMQRVLRHLGYEDPVQADLPG